MLVNHFGNILPQHQQLQLSHCSDQVADVAALISVSSALSQAPVYTARPRIRHKLSCGVPAYVPAFSGTHCAYPQRDGQAELTWRPGKLSHIIIRKSRIHVHHGAMTNYSNIFLSKSINNFLNYIGQKETRPCHITSSVEITNTSFSSS